jgi:pimeloyl-ACP methyl ester carboxylesterase
VDEDIADVGMDTHNRSIHATILRPGESQPDDHTMTTEGRTAGRWVWNRYAATITIRRLAIPVLLAAATGCQAPPLENPSFRITKDEAVSALRAMKKDPQPLERPLVILSGWRDPGMGGWWLSEQYNDFFDDDRILIIAYSSAKNMDAARAKVIAEVDKAYPTDDPDRTVAVDVIGISLGGLVGRYAAMPARDDPDARRLNVVRLFTLASPHRGAIVAEMDTPDEFGKELRPGSEFIEWINATDTDPDLELFAYVRLGDDIVGVEEAAPAGVDPWWLDNPPFEHAHIGGTLDKRFMAEIVRRLRNEPAYTTPPPAPPPAPAP